MRSIVKILLICGLTIIWSCSETLRNDDEDTGGRLLISITDDPFDINYVESATVTITKIEIRKAGENEGNPFVTVSEDTLKIDLINLRNGITKEIADLEIPQGTYDLIRLYIGEAGLKIKDNPKIYNLKIPSGSQTGIKVFVSPAITVSGGLTSELLIDFDLSGSFVMRGNMKVPHSFKGFIFKPVIRAVNNTKAGRVTGMVTDTLKAKIVNAKIWLKKDTVVATAFSDTLGKYAIIGVPAGTYSIFAAKETYDTITVNNLKVTEGNQTVQNFILTKKK